MADIFSNILHVEGKEDLRVIPELIEANGIKWGTRKSPIVKIRDYDGVENLIDKIEISVALKATGLERLGLLVDADGDPQSRWLSIKNACMDLIPKLPDALPESGLIHRLEDGRKFGVWMMPDNKTQGMLETFLAYLVPEEGERLWDYAQAIAQSAKSKGALFSDAQQDKANIYTWLAWQTPPGRQLHNAIMERIFDPKHPRGQAFVTWFRNLYDL